MSSRILVSLIGLLPNRLNRRTASGIGTANGFKMAWSRVVIENLKNLGKMSANCAGCFSENTAHMVLTKIELPIARTKR
jgi:hypothetical protein